MVFYRQTEVWGALPKPFVASCSKEIFVFNLLTRPFLLGAIETVAVLGILLNTIYDLSIKFKRLYCQEVKKKKKEKIRYINISSSYCLKIVSKCMMCIDVALGNKYFLTRITLTQTPPRPFIS